MLNRIIKFSLDNRFLIILTAVIIVIVGVYTTLNMDIDVFPDLTAPTVVVLTDAHGMAAEEVERLVTFPIETSVNGATDVRRVRSVSAQGYSFVWVEFDWGTDIFKARQIVSEKLNAVSAQMPLDVGIPTMAPQSSVMGEMFFLGLQSDRTDLMDLRTIAEWNIKPLLLATSGVSQVTIIGGDYKEYQVLADPQKMKFAGVSFSELAETCRSMSQNATGSVVRQHGNEYVLRGLARTADLDTLGRTFIKMRQGKPISVMDVADIKIAGAPKMGYASENAQPAIIISVSKQPKTNTLDLTRRIEANLMELKKTLPADVDMNTKIFRQADFIETAIGNVQRALLEGSVFVIIVLFLFLGRYRTTLISLIAMPISLLGSIIVLNKLGLSINTMSLGGMAIAIGSLVDDAIIDVENVYKRLKQNFRRPPAERDSAFQVVFEASKEIRSSILNATLIIIVAFLPLFFLSGMEGRMLKPLGISFVVSLFISLIVAMTLTPLLCNMFLSRESFLKKSDKEPWFTQKLASGYKRSLSWALEHRKIVVSTALILFVIAIFSFSTLGRSFLPEFNEGSLTISVICQPGTSLEESNKLGNLVEKELLAIQEIASTARRTGRGELDEHSQTVNSAEIDVNFTLNERNREEFLDEVRARLTGIPGIASTVGQPLGHRIDHMLSGTRANIAIKLFGHDLNTLFRLGNSIKNVLKDLPGLVDLSVEQLVEIPQIQIRAKRDMMAAQGISLKRFNEFINLAFGGDKMSDIYEGQMRFDLVLRLHSDYTQTLEGIRSALIDTEDGRKVPLEEVAEIVSSSGPSAISRENVQRKLVVSGNIAGRDLRGVVKDIQNRVENQIKLPKGYRIEFGGQFENEARASQILLLTSLISLVIIFLLLFLEFNNQKLAAIILLNLPLALIGGVFAITFSSGTLSIPAIIGFITLFGIATRNGILLISSYQSLHDSTPNFLEAIITGSIDRLNPILMTALTSALALIPLALQGDLSGNEIQSPMARVILGGLLTSTLLNIYFIPVVYSLFQKYITTSGRGK